MRRANVFGCSVNDIDKLEWIQKGNQLPNFDEFIDKVLYKKSVEDVFELWQYVKSLTHAKEESMTYEWFKHDLGTLLISCKEWKNSGSHGMRYGNLCVTTYQNNSIPNLYEFGVTFSQYEINPLDFKSNK